MKFGVMSSEMRSSVMTVSDDSELRMDKLKEKDEKRGEEGLWRSRQ
jgi:hypothetical protein